MRILKYRCEIDFGQSIVLPLPATAKILSIQHQIYSTQLWAMVDEDHTIVGGRRIYCFATGQDLPGNVHDLEYIATVEDQRGLVSHYFTPKV